MLWSGNLVSATKQSIVSNQVTDLMRLGYAENPLSASHIERLISDALKEPPAHWSDFWDSLIARHFGLPAMGLEALNRQLGERGQAVILVFDGIEMRSRTLPLWRRAKPFSRCCCCRTGLTNCRTGTSDHGFRAGRLCAEPPYGKTSPSSWRAMHRSIAMEPGSLSGLAFWLCARAGIVDDEPAKAEVPGAEALLEKLLPLWGRKLGHDTSRGILGTLDLCIAMRPQEMCRPRDLVRFLRFAAEIETDRQGSTWQDRVLAPESLRKAIPVQS